MPHVVPATPNGCRRWDAATAGKRGQAKGTSVHYGCYEGEMYAGPFSLLGRGAPTAAEIRSQGAIMSVKKEASGRRSVQVEVEVPGTPEEVWQAIASGP